MPKIVLRSVKGAKIRRGKYKVELEELKDFYHLAGGMITCIVKVKHVSA